MKNNNLMRQRPSRRALDLIAAYRAIGMTDQEILAEMRKLQAQKSAQQPAQPDGSSTALGAGQQDSGGLPAGVKRNE